MAALLYIIFVFKLASQWVGRIFLMSYHGRQCPSILEYMTLAWSNGVEYPAIGSFVNKMERSALAISDLVSKIETDVCDGYIFLPCGQKLPAEALNCRDYRECRVMRREPQKYSLGVCMGPFLGRPSAATVCTPA